jgi:hypothetical protein
MRQRFLHWGTALGPFRPAHGRTAGMHGPCMRPWLTRRRGGIARAEPSASRHFSQCTGYSHHATHRRRSLDSRFHMHQTENARTFSKKKRRVSKLPPTAAVASWELYRYSCTRPTSQISNSATQSRPGADRSIDGILYQWTAVRYDSMIQNHGCTLRQHSATVDMRGGGGFSRFYRAVTLVYCM